MTEPPFEPLDFERRPPEEPFDPMAEHGPVRGFFRSNPDTFARVRRWVRQSRLGTAYDAYLARVVSYTVVAAVVGALLGALAALALGALGDWPRGALPVFVGGLTGALLAGTGCALGGYLYPALCARRRANAIDAQLPHATVFLFALAHGGADLHESIERVGDAKRTYGTLAGEFELLTTETKRFGPGMFSALERVRRDTPSDAFETFLDELNSVLETGGDANRFLRNQADEHIERAERLQERLLDDLQTLAEVYVTLVFAAPVFLVVLLVVISFTQSTAFTRLRQVVYLGIPLAVLAFYALFRSEVGPYAHRERDVRLADEDLAPPDDERVADYEAAKRSAYERFLRRPVESALGTPRVMLYAGGAFGVLLALALALAGVVPATPEAALAAPVTTTTAAILPLCTAGGAFAAVYHRRRRRQREIRRELPAALAVLADANHSGVPLDESFDLVARRLSGPLAEEFDRLHNDVRWTRDVSGALSRFADRVGVSAVSRTVALLVESIHTTNDLAPVFEVAGDNLSRRNDLRNERRRGMRPYVLVVAIGVFVFLGIVLVFETRFIPVAARTGDVAATQAAAVPVRAREIDPIAYRTLFYHAALIQAGTNGLLAGLLVDDRLATGVKYAVALVAVTAGLFLLF